MGVEQFHWIYLHKHNGVPGPDDQPRAATWTLRWTLQEGARSQELRFLDTLYEV